MIEASQAGDVLPTVLAGPGYNGATMHYSSDVHLEFRDANGETFKISHMWPNRIAFSGPRPTEKRGVVRMEVDGEPQEWPVELAVSTCFDDSVLIVRDW